MLKKCTKCGVERPLTDFYKSKHHTDGIRSNCKICIKQYAENNKTRKAEYMRQYYLAKKGEIALYKQQYYLNNKAQLTLKNKNYVQENKSKIVEYKRKYYQDNKNNITKQKQIYNADTFSQRAKQKRRYYLVTRDATLARQRKYYLENKPRILSNVKAYRNTPMGNAVQKNKQHRRRSILNKGAVSTKQLLELHQKATNCFWCYAPLNGVRVHVDPVYPLSKGGEHTLDNLVIACASCNLQKGAKDPIEFINTLLEEGILQ